MRYIGVPWNQKSRTALKPNAFYVYQLTKIRSPNGLLRRIRDRRTPHNVRRSPRRNFLSREGPYSSRGQDRKLRSAQVLSRHGSWPNGITEAPAVRAIVCQMVITHAIIGWVNASVLRAIRKLPSPALQEMIARSLLIPLAIGDILRQLGMFYGMGGIRREAEGWPQPLWLNVIVGIALFIPRFVRRDHICDGS
jgi:hypothetical protein